MKMIVLMAICGLMAKVTAAKTKKDVEIIVEVSSVDSEHTRSKSGDMLFYSGLLNCRCVN